MEKPRKNCIVCEDIINRSNSRGCAKLRRGSKDVTCSRKCAKVYSRVYNYVNNSVMRRESKKRKNERKNKF